MTITEPRTGQGLLEAQASNASAAQTPSGDHRTPGTQTDCVLAGFYLLADQATRDDQATSVSEVPGSANTGTTTESPAPTRAQNSAIDQPQSDNQTSAVGGGSTSRVICPECRQERSLRTDGLIRKHRFPGEPTGVSCGGSLTLPATSPATIPCSVPKIDTSPGISDSVTDQTPSDAQVSTVGDALVSPAPASHESTPSANTPVLVDHHLAVLANRVNDLENFRKASANQLEVLTRATVDKDGEERGYGLHADHPAVVQSQAIVDAIKKIEDQTVRELEKLLKTTPMGPWIVGQKGLGAKTIARLLAATGDPYWNSLHDRPRTVSELWAFCGYRPGQKKVKGEKVNWSPEAKMRAHLLMDPIKKMLSKPCHSVKGGKGEYLYAVHVEGECTCSPYRVLYDQARDKYRDSVHPAECVRCGPKGKPALPGSPISGKHQDAMAYRLVKKAILRDLWREAKRLHELPGDHSRSDAHPQCIAGVPNSSAGQNAYDAQKAIACGGPT